MNDFQNEPISQEEKKKNRKKWLLILLLVLLIATCVTSCMVGYLVGRKSMPPVGGEVVDVIALIPPETEPAQEEPADEKTEAKEGVVSVSGVVRYTDGTPLAEQTLEFHSEPRVTETDKHGYFFYHMVELGEHTLYLLDDDGRKIAQIELELDTDELGMAVVRTKSGDYTLDFHEDTLMLEVEIEVDRKELDKVRASKEEPRANMELVMGGAFLPDGSYFLFDESGKMQIDRVAIGGILKTRLGNWLFSDGTAFMPNDYVLLNDQTLIRPFGYVTFPSGDVRKAGSVIRRPGGAAITPCGTILTEGGYVIFPATGVVHPDFDVTLRDGTTIDGETMETTLASGVVVDPGQKKVTLPDGTVITLEGNQVILPDGSVIILGKDELTLPNGTIIRPKEQEIILPNGAIVDLGDNKVILPDGTVIDPVEGTVTPPASEDDEVLYGPGLVTISSEGKNWNQFTYVNLFAKIDLVYPGMEGSYKFKITNTRDLPVEFSVRFKDFHETPIPFTYWVTDSSGEWISLSEQILGAHSSEEYVLHWVWPFERGFDEYDTMLGNSDQLIHPVSIRVHAEEVG